MKERESSIELLRIIAMFMVLLLHANYMAFGFPSTADATWHPLNTFCRIFFEQACTIAVNIYVLISGYFGIKHRLNSFVGLLLQVISYTTAILLFQVIFFDKKLQITDLYDIIIVGKQHWFIYSYILLYILAPVLNEFVLNSPKRRIIQVLFLLFVFEVCYGWSFGLEGYLNGYSALHFIGLYIFARFIHTTDCHIANKSILCYSIAYITITLLTSGYVWYALHSKGQDLGSQAVLSQISYNSPWIILSSISFFLIFTKIHFSSKKINYIAKSSLSVYLIHTNLFVWPLYLSATNYIYTRFYNLLGVLLILCFIAAVFFGSILIDKIRLLITPTNWICNQCRIVKTKLFDKIILHENTK